MVKSVKGQKKYRKKRSSTKLFKIDEETAKGVGLGVLAAAGVLSLGYAGVLAPIIKKNRLKAQEDREAATIATTVERRMIERRDSAKNKALKAFEDLKALGNSVLTSPRPSGIYSPTSTVKGSPRMSVAPKTPVFSVLDSITVVPKSSPVLRTQIPPGGSKGSSSKNKSNIKKTFKCKYHNNCEVSADGFHRLEDSISRKKSPPTPSFSSYNVFDEI